MPTRRSASPAAPAAPAAPGGPGRVPACVTVVVATRDRRDELSRSLRILYSLPERPEVTVVDNASSDGTADMVARFFPQVRLIRLRRNQGAAARNAGVGAAGTPYVAFSDDDSWWEPGALACAARLFERHPRLGAVAARTLVGPSGHVDPVSRAQEASPLPSASDLPGPAILGFLACSAVVRRSAFLAVGGFSPVLFFGGEERLLAYDLTAAGWGVCYAGELTARHFPSPSRDPAGRDTLLRRNEILTLWMRRPLCTALVRTCACATQASRDRTARRVLALAAARLPEALAHRRPLPPAVEKQAQMIESMPCHQANLARLSRLSTGPRGIPRPWPCSTYWWTETRARSGTY
jgi:GT2 family glycosyltransferase